MPKLQENKGNSRGLRFRSSIVVGETKLTSHELVDYARRDPAEFARKVRGLIEDRKLTLDSITDIRSFFNNMAGIEIPVNVEMLGQTRAITSSAFPTVMSQLMIARVNDRIASSETIGDQLVDDMEDNKKRTIIIGLTDKDNGAKRVRELETFPEVSAGEETFEIGHNRNGRMISITKEMIEENDILNIERRLDFIADLAIDLVEERTLMKVCDVDGSGATPAAPYVLMLGGVGVPLYQTNNTTLTRLGASGNRIPNNALASAANLSAARQALAAMRNSRGTRIANPLEEMILLVPSALVEAAYKIINAPMTPGVENESNPWGPNGLFRPRLLWSPRLDDISPTAWYLGAFKKQFTRKWKLRYESASITQNFEEMVSKRVLMKSSFAWDCEIGATGYERVVQNLAATTPPSVPAT